MGRDKALVELAGVPLAVRAARALAQVAYPLLAVGTEAGTGLDAIDDPREGPLVAFATGAEALRARGASDVPIFVVACDLPFVQPALLGHLAAALGDADAAVPVLAGRDQPLAACYAPSAAPAARRLVDDGARAMRDLLAAIRVRRVPEEEWTQVAPASSLADVDTPEDLAAASRILDAPA